MVDDREGLAEKRCSPCRGGVAPLTEAAALALSAGVPGWRLEESATRLHRRFEFRDFREAMKFVNRAAEVAEQEGHHPDLHLEGYRDVTVEVWTHAIGGLSENDFILAAKIDALPIALKRQSARKP